MIKIYICADKNHKSKKIREKIKKKVKLTSIKKCKFILVIGGDGYMLETLKKYYKYKKPFYGINSGDYGFLMNKFSEKKLIHNLHKTDLVKISPLQMVVKNQLGKTKKSIAINEISILRQSRQAVSISIKSGSKYIIRKLRGDGLLVSTPAGSTAYNLSVHGPILNLDSSKLAISPVSPFRPRRWKGKIISNRSLIEIKNLNPKKRPISAVADNVEVRNAVKIKVRENKKIIFYLMYNKNNSIEKKIKIEQLRNEIGH
tara:strand:- start:610 stop:1383 length:774 start_codon:yes stop_codon:yes gene_type:complete